MRLNKALIEQTERPRNCAFQLLINLNFTSAVIKVLYFTFMLYDLLKKILATKDQKHHVFSVL